MTTDFQYVGTELDVFQHAVNWKQYWRAKIEPYMGPQVLEVGAGIGGTTQIFADYTAERWVALEPDGDMVALLEQQQNTGALPAHIDITRGTVQDLAPDDLFDTLLYIDVLEHIEDHQTEVEHAARQVAPGGHIIILSPAFQFLFTPFDEAIGHYRRYRKRDLVALTPQGCQVKAAFYLDAVGMLTSVGNKLLLQSSEPTLGQIRLWDRYIVPVSRLVDPLLGYRLGRSVVCIWERIA